MKNVLSKALATIGLVSMIATAANAAADNEIIITGDVSTTVVVGFADVSGGGTNDTFVGEDIALGTIAAGATFAPQTFNVYVLTNNAAGVSMTITDGAGGIAGELQGAGVDIPVTYSLEGATYTPGTTGAVNIVTTVSDGATSESAFVVTPDAAATSQTAGTYTTTLNVTVAAI